MSGYSPWGWNNPWGDGGLLKSVYSPEFVPPTVLGNSITEERTMGTPLQNTQKGLSSEAKQRVAATAKEQAWQMGVKALTTGLTLASMDAPKSIIGDGVIHSVMNPSNMLSFPANAVYAAKGIQPETFSLSKPTAKGLLGSAVQYVPAFMGTLVSGPVGFLGGLMGAPFADTVQDISGMRHGDVARDELEDAVGEIRGRRVYADAMTNVGDHSLAELDSFNAAAKEADRRVKQMQPLSYSMMSPDMHYDMRKQTDAYRSMASKISTQNYIDGGFQAGWGGRDEDRKRGFGWGTTTPGTVYSLQGSLLTQKPRRGQRNDAVDGWSRSKGFRGGPSSSIGGSQAGRGLGGGSSIGRSTGKGLD